MMRHWAAGRLEYWAGYWAGSIGFPNRNSVGYQRCCYRLWWKLSRFFPQILTLALCPTQWEESTHSMELLTYKTHFFFSELGFGISFNSILLLFHILKFLLEHRPRTTDLFIGLLALIHLGMLTIMGFTAVDTFATQNTWDDITCQSLVHLHRFLRGLSLCGTCLLSVIQAVTLSPRSSCLAKFKINPHSTACVSFSCCGPSTHPVVFTSGSPLLLTTTSPHKGSYLSLTPALFYPWAISAGTYLP